jgi:hypothetical protein
MSDRNLEQQTNIKFYVMIGKCASEMSAELTALWWISYEEIESSWMA